MNLIEALKTGREIRKGPQFVWLNPSSHNFNFSIDEVLMDWEVKPEKFELTVNMGMSPDVLKMNEILMNNKCKVTVEILK